VGIPASEKGRNKTLTTLKIEKRRKKAGLTEGKYLRSLCDGLQRGPPTKKNYLSLTIQAEGKEVPDSKRGGWGGSYSTQSDHTGRKNKGPQKKKKKPKKEKKKKKKGRKRSWRREEGNWGVACGTKKKNMEQKKTARDTIRKKEEVIDELGGGHWINNQGKEKKTEKKGEGLNLYVARKKEKETSAVMKKKKVTLAGRTQTVETKRGKRPAA